VVGLRGCRRVEVLLWRVMSVATDRAAALEMVPQDLLRDWLCRQDGGVTAAIVAVEWAVSPWLAAVALGIAAE
jgi:hypothetical protein